MSIDDQTIKILIVLARYYRDASDDLLKGATTELDKYKKRHYTRSIKFLLVGLLITFVSSLIFPIR